MRICTWAFALGLTLIPASVADQPPIGDFSLADYHGKTFALADFKEKPILVVAFVGTECPLAKLYGPRLADLEKEFGMKGVGFLGIDPNAQDGVTQIAAFARLHGITFPILKDLNNLATD